MGLFMDPSDREDEITSIWTKISRLIDRARVIKKNSPDAFNCIEGGKLDRLIALDDVLESFVENIENEIKVR